MTAQLLVQSSGAIRRWILSKVVARVTAAHVTDHTVIQPFQLAQLTQAAACSQAHPVVPVLYNLE